MPKFLELYGWRFFAVTFDLQNEPFHVHVTDKGKKECKYWILPDGQMQLAYSRGFSRVEHNRIQRAIKNNLVSILSQYEAYCHENDLSLNYKNLS